MGKQITDELINAVIRGDYGNGAQRKDALTKADYDYSQVQAAINNKLYGSGSSSTPQTTTQNQNAIDIGAMPEYVSKYQGQIDSLTRELLNRKAFEYNPEEDKTYQQYAKDYRRYGEMAMEDTLGKVAARTGGLASSYATSAAQQSYNSYMAALASKIPELEQLAYSMYLSEGDQLKDRLSLLSSLEDNNYANYQDQLSAYLKTLGGGNGGSGSGGSGSGGSGGNSIFEDVDETPKTTYGDISLDRMAYRKDPFGLNNEDNLRAGYNLGLIDEDTYLKRREGLLRLKQDLEKAQNFLKK